MAARVMEALGFTVRPLTIPMKPVPRSKLVQHAVEWPMLLTPLDTSGEKPYEEFVGQGEHAVPCGLETLLAMGHVPSRAQETGLFEQIENSSKIPIPR